MLPSLLRVLGYNVNPQTLTMSRSSRKYLWIIRGGFTTLIKAEVLAPQ